MTGGSETPNSKTTGPDASIPSLRTGYCIIISAVLFFVLGSYATLLSAFYPRTGVWILDVLAADTHYKYFILFLIPTTSYFVIANWVGWQYYRHS
ncbi:hypothetical protein DAEQUDRAFT_811681 [Daedalea quercina L-15889]|uniref:Uncharacterized protein n=1 Tax=Daedalea quercina L-15889 TaxID=1314783 RepID=A0A165Q4W2_9APHY|nr:hypothetical protein DAEQUDRAFT_811681 [Daedalea quercina L-15889]